MKKLIALSVLFLITFSWVAGASAQGTIQVAHNEAVLRFPDGVRFELSATSAEAIESILLVYRTSGRSCQLREVRQPINLKPGTDHQVEFMWDWERSGILPPGAQVAWHWEITDAKGNLHRTPEETLQVIDQRRKWKTIRDEKIVLSWYAGSDEFGQELYQITASGLQKLQEEFGIQPDGVVHITVYASPTALRDALQSSTSWVGGVAFPQHNSMLIAVSPEELSWAAELIPHELTHLVIGVLTFNCRGAGLPTWLEEGLAEVIQAPISRFEMGEIKKALRNDRLPTLKSLEGSFSAYGDEARLAYSQSKQVADYLITTYGKEDLHLLLATIQTGAHIDTALQEVYGFNTHQLDAEWRASLGFEATPMPERASNTPTIVPTLALISPINLSTDTPEPSAPAPTGTSRPATKTPSPAPTPAAPAAPEDQTPGPSPKNSIIAFIILVVITGPAVFGFFRWRQSHLANN